MQLIRAYSVLTIKAVDEEKRELTGIATTPSTDSYGDIVDSEGAEYTLPIPLLWQHRSDQPIGHVTKAKATKDGIEVVARLVTIEEPGTLKDRLDEAWQSVKSTLVRGFSIGFSPIEYTRIADTYSYRYIKWAWRELSVVTIPANTDATITAIKSISTEQRAALGLLPRRGVTLITTHPGVSGNPSVTRKRGPVQLIPRNPK